MSLPDYDFFHGAAIIAALRVRGEAGGHIRVLDGLTRGAYSIDGDALYVKHSSSRMSPWTFSFAKEHVTAIELLAESYENVFLALVCGHDGIAVLTFDEVRTLFGAETTPWLRVDRRVRKMYGLSGSAGELSRKVAHGW